MAGGPNAATILCLHCAGKANRVSEGIEDDLYRCEECGRGFGIDWSSSQPEKPCWPPTPEYLAEAKRMVALMAERKKQTP
jgi:hypothetical protein